jgi:ABC-2 type transport system ATP-binding protein/lipopolysaccharide transport system ATP-binding protein
VTTATILLENVWVEYAIYGLANRSLKKTLVDVASRGRLAREVQQELSRVVALKGISLRVNDGDRLGVVGANGAGKTTLLRVMAGALKPARGRIRRVGFTSSLFDVSLGMNSEANGWDNIILRGLYLGLTLPEIRALADEIAEFSGLTEEQLACPVRTYSSGMQVRLAFSISTAVRPDILLLDEWISAGDAAFVEKAKQRMNDLVDQSRILIFATHYDWLLTGTCNRAICLEDGQIVADGPVADTLAFYHGNQPAAA